MSVSRRKALRRPLRIGSASHVSLPLEQLALKLGLPWDGYSPRSLTRASALFSFVRKGTGRSNLELSRVVQLELFPEGTHYGS